MWYMWGTRHNKSVVGLQKFGASRRPQETPIVIQWKMRWNIMEFCKHNDGKKGKLLLSLQHLAQSSESARLKWRLEIVAQQIFDAPQPHHPLGHWAIPKAVVGLASPMTSIASAHISNITTGNQLWLERAKHPIGSLQITGFPSKIIKISVWRHESSKSP